MRQLIIILLGLLISVQLTAQEFEFTEALKLNDDVNSLSEEINPRITEDGNTLYFTRTFSKKNVGGKYAGQDIWYSQRNGSAWGDAHNLKALNNADNNAVVGLNEEADKLYLINNYSAHPRRVQGLVVTGKTEKNKWSDVSELPVKVEVRNDHYGFYLTPDEEILVISMMAESTLGEEDLFVSFNKDGNWTEPKHLGAVINSTGFEISPFLSADKQTLYFGSNGFGGEGDSDIFSTTRLDDSWVNWSEPKNLGTNINSSAFDAYFVMNNSGNAYFASSRELTGMSDIYYSEAKLIEEAEEEIIEVVEKKEETVEKVADVAVEEPVKEEAIVEKISPLPEAITIYFDFESDELIQKEKSKLDMIVKEIVNEKIQSSYHGEKKLFDEGDEEDNHKMNRRVELVIKKIK